MKATTLAAAALMILVSGAGSSWANSADDPESAFVIDLTPAGGHSFHIHCEHNAPLSSCRNPSLWENTNLLRGLQTKATATPSGTVQADKELLS